MDTQSNINKPNKGLYLNGLPSEQPDGTYRFALNSVLNSEMGGHRNLSNEPSIDFSAVLPPNFNMLGNKYVGDNTIIIIGIDTVSKKEFISLLHLENDSLVTLVETKVLKLDVRHELKIVYRKLANGEKIIYWVDGKNGGRCFNLTEVQDYYSAEYTFYLATGGNPSLYTGEKFRANAFLIQKRMDKIPYVSRFEVTSGGRIKAGSYNICICLCDEDYSPTEFLYESEPIKIYNSSIEDSYPSIQGNYYQPNEFFFNGESNKIIKATIEDLDIRNYPFYRVAIVQSFDGTGNVSRVLLSEIISCENKIFTYAGNDETYTEIPLSDILTTPKIIHAPDSIEIVEDRLILANAKEEVHDWCEFQKAASRIGSIVVTQNVQLRNIKSLGNSKRPTSSVELTGEMPGEVASYGIVYIMDDFTHSPAFHIPGRSPHDTSTSRNNFRLYEAGFTYPNIHDCEGKSDYWGKDYMGRAITNQPVRFHKFPTREELNAPLKVTKTLGEVTNTYRLSTSIILAPGKTYPLDINNNPLSIGYNFSLTTEVTQVVSYYSGVVSPNSLNGSTIIYQSDLEGLVSFNGLYYVLTGELAPYVADGTFIVVQNYERVPTAGLSGYKDATVTPILGVRFFNIPIPSPRVIGYYIVKQKPTDVDKIVIDNAILGPVGAWADTYTFGFLNPDYKLVGPNYRDTDETRFAHNILWYLSPEEMFLKKKLNFEKADMNHKYIMHNADMPLHFRMYPHGSSFYFYPGLWIEDVQSGTSYDPSIHKKREKDSDGFSLQAAYLGIDYSDIILDNSQPIPPVVGTFTMDAANYTASEIPGKTFYNASLDNRIGIMRLKENVPIWYFKANWDGYSVTYNTQRFPGVDQSYMRKSRLGYAALRRGSYLPNGTFKDFEFVYQDFMTRSYHKTHAEPKYFKTNLFFPTATIYSGQTYVSEMNIVSSMFKGIKMAKRDNKVSVWRYIAGAALIVVAAVLTVISAGAGSITLAAAITGAGAIIAGAAGVALVQSGMKIDNLIKLYEEGYEKGALHGIETLSFADYLSPTDKNANSFGNNMTQAGIEDDTIQWMSDVGGNFIMESRVPVSLRTETVNNSGTYLKDYSVLKGNQLPFLNYLQDKLTVVDREQQNGRLYKGFPTAEVYEVNADYMRFGDMKQFSPLPLSYDCCTSSNADGRLVNRVYWSEKSFSDEKRDHFRKFLPNNYKDLPGETGGITNLVTLGNSLLIYTEEAMWRLPQAIQERTTTELTSYLGTGDFFSISPEKIVDDSKSSYGTTSGNTTEKTKFGIFNICEKDRTVTVYAGEIKDICQDTVSRFTDLNIPLNFRKYFPSEMSFESRKIFDNPSSLTGTGYSIVYDDVLRRILITKKDFKPLLPLVVDPVITLGVGVEATIIYNSSSQKFYTGSLDGSGAYKIFREIHSFVDNPEVFEDCSFTMSYDINNRTWVSFHSYLPNNYLSAPKQLLSFEKSVPGDVTLDRHHSQIQHGYYKGLPMPHVIEFVENVELVRSKTFESLSYISSVYNIPKVSNFVEVVHETFDSVLVYNDLQSSGELDIKVRTESEEDFFGFSTDNDLSGVKAERVYSTWSFNGFRDMTNSNQVPLFTKDWSDIKNEYFIDKKVNPLAMNYNKDWMDIAPFNGSYICYRLTKNNTTGNNIITQFLGADITPQE